MLVSNVKSATIIRIGLGLVFLANSLAAFLAPAEFIELIGRSFLPNILPINMAVFPVVIGVNDTLVAALLLLNVGRRWISAWAAIWIVGVMAAKGISLDTLEEFGFLAMALALAQPFRSEGLGSS